MKNRQKKRIVFALFVVILSAIIIFPVYALFETNTNVPVFYNTAKWNVKVNNTMITNGIGNENTFQMGSIEWETRNHVKEGKAAPGSEGVFHIEIDPTDTQVSFIYTIDIDTDKLKNSEFVIKDVKENNGKEFIRTGKNTYTGIAYLADTNNGQKYNIEINIKWNDNEDNNENDYNLGVSAIEDINIPITINLTQYTGEETFIEYEEI